MFFQDLPDDMKRKHELKKMCTSILASEFPRGLEYVIKFMKIKSLPSTQRMHHTMMSRLETFVPRISILELNQAIDNFNENNVIAIDEMGTTYKGMLSNRYCLAIKRLVRNSPHIEHEFVSEITTLGRLRHANLVELIGFCDELTNHRFLIYKSITRTSLHSYLFSSQDEAMIMGWPVRAKIAVGIAKGIVHLHFNKVIHRRISSKCILLEDDFNPRISDFGRATTLNHNNWSLDHKEFSTLYLEDVHSFGIVLLELITGTEYKEIFSSFDIEADMFEQISQLLITPGPVGVCVRSMMEQGFGDDISRFLSVAGKCLECDPCNLPNMKEVYRMLIGKTRDDATDTSDSAMKNEIELADIQND